MPEKKTENYSFRLTPSMKLDILKRSGELGIQPGEYVISLIEKDLASKANDLPEREKTFIEKQFHEFTESLLSFMVEKFDKKLNRIESRMGLTYYTTYQSMMQSAQGAVRSKEILSSLWKDEAKVNALDDKIKIRIKAIQEDIKKKIESGDSQ
jgi:hypothetical protein